MRKHEPTFSEIIKGRCSFAGINLGDLEKKAGIPHTTMWKRMKDGEWTRDRSSKCIAFCISRKRT